MSECPYESAVIAAVRSGHWGSGLRSHTEQCAECTEAARVGAWLGTLANGLGRDAAPPDPGYIWLTAEIERRAREVQARPWRRRLLTGAVGLAAWLLVSAAVLAVLPNVATVVSALSAALSPALSALSPALSTLSPALAALSPTVIASAANAMFIAAVWLGFPILLMAVYLIVLKPLR